MCDILSSFLGVRNVAKGTGVSSSLSFLNCWCTSLNTA